MGLSLVRALTELHGGTVTVRSDGPGLGSEFTVRLPVATPEAERTPTPTVSHAPSSEARVQGRRVLVVDDHREVASGLERLLRVLGYDVRTELDPHDAIAAAVAFRPKVALLDIGLPGMDGYALAQELRTRLGDDAPVLIALSGYNQLQDRRRSQAAGFATHLVKPVDVDDLVGALEQYGGC
jgi:CheY-like chemotaxis protein